MTKPELITIVSHKTGQTKTATERTLEALVDVIAETLQKGEDVKLLKFGKFYARKKDAFVMNNNLYCEEISVPAKVVVKFAAAKALKDKLNA